MPDLQVVVEECIAEGNKVMTWSTLIGTIEQPAFGYPASDKVLSISAMAFWTITPNGEIQTICTMFDMEIQHVVEANTRQQIAIHHNQRLTGSLRGFEANSLGPNYLSPAYTVPQPLGGSFKTIGTFELIFPRLIKAKGTRLSAFLDFGNVFATRGDFDSKDIRVAAGLALQWQAPIGPISISYAIPLRYEQGTLVDADGAGPGTALRRDGADRVERLQFTFGSQF